MQLEVSTDKTQLLKDSNVKHQKRTKFLYIIVVVFGLIILSLLIINLWQADVFKTNDSEDNLLVDDCNGNGHSYNDLNECECFQCYSGDKCEIEQDNCMISAGSGDPILLMEYWNEQRRKNRIKPLITEIDYRMSYSSGVSRGPHSENSNSGLGGKLNQLIRKFHAKYNNVNMTDTYLVYGLGATQLNTAAYVAFSDIIGRQITAFAEVPYYFGYPRNCEAAGTARCIFSSSTELNESNVVEYNVIPGNPSGQIRERVYKNATMYANDLVYYWPTYIHDDDGLNPLDAPVSFFSATKLTGHGSTRFGWAFVKSLALAERMTGYLGNLEMVFPVDDAHRAYQFLSHLDEYSDEFFEFTRGRMKDRYDVLLDILSGQNNYILSGLPSHFFAWIECVNKNETEVMALFRSYNMNPFAGSSFGASVAPNSFVRIGMHHFENNFVKMMEEMRLLVDNER